MVHVVIMWPAAAVCRHTVLVEGKERTINPNPNPNPDPDPNPNLKQTRCWSRVRSGPLTLTLTI